jgi:hypothetical protein
MKRTRQQKATYRQTALGILRTFGAQLDPTERRMYQIETRLGTLRISVWDDMLPCVFDEVKRAAAELGSGTRINPFSGKWNFDGGLTHTQDMGDLALFANELRRLLPEGYQPNPDLPLLPYED